MHRLRLGFLLAAVLAQPWSWAQSRDAYPNKPIRMVIAFPPGGSNDLIARFVGTRLTQRLGQQIVYDYRGGAAGVIGTEIAARATPDGYTLLFASTSHTMNEVIRKVPYDTLGSFAPVAMFGRGPNVLVANAAFPAKTLPELIAMARASPGKIADRKSTRLNSSHVSESRMPSSA